MKRDAKLLVDFRGGRTEFGVATFYSDGRILSNVPTFLRLDEYDSPFDPLDKAISTILRREYPKFFSN